MEPFFEQYPILFVPLVILIIEAWQVTKAWVAGLIRRNDSRSA